MNSKTPHKFEPNPIRAPKFRGLFNWAECRLCRMPREHRVHIA